MAPGSRLQELTAKYMQNPRRYFVPLANEYRKSNDLDRAIALCREHLPSQPGHMSGHIVLGRAYYEKGDVDAAREVFLTSVELDDENLIALRHLGDIAKAHHQLNEARQWYARVLDADPQNVEIERLLASLGTADGAVPEVEVTPPLVAAAADEPPIGAATELQADVPREDFGASLTDPTPPGLRAITHRADFVGALDAAEPGTDRPAPDPRVPLDRFDLSTLAAEVPRVAADDSPSVEALEPEIRVDDGVGFVFDELDALVDPAATSATGSLPSVDEADFSAGISTPTSPAIVPSEPVAAEILSRPGFGALASLASWRTAQGRDTPTSPAAHPTPSAPTPAQPSAPADADAGLFWQPAASEATSTAPEFITETMALLYEKQGFLPQALEVYQALMARAPGDLSLRAKVAELRVLLAATPGAAALTADADSALDFADDAFDAGRVGQPSASIGGTADEVSPSSPGDEELASAFESAWEGPQNPEGDWFADVPDAALATDADSSAGEIFGVTSDVFGIPARAARGESLVRSAAGVVTTLAAVFGSPSVIATDETAAELLRALASEMVGRLPKEAPVLPVPDVLDLPTAAASDGTSGASPAPLLSFDRFFSGSGAPPRARPDTPVSSLGLTDPWQSAVSAPVPAPSLSPTFGGVPVIPPASVTPATWAAFEQFLPSPSGPVSTPASTPLAAEPIASAPSLAPVAPSPGPWPTTPATAPPSLGVPPAPTPAAAVPATPDTPIASASPVAEPSSSEVTPTENVPSVETTRAAPSDFHRWLEGLS